MSGTRLAGIQCLVFLFFYLCGPCMGEAMDSRLLMSGMTEGGLKAWGMTEGGIDHVGHDGRHALPLCHAAGPPLSFPPDPFVIPAGCQRESSILLCCSFICVAPAWRKAMDSRLKMSGMTEGGIEGVGHDGMSALPLCHAAGPLCHARRPLSVMPPGTLCHARRFPR